MKQFIYSLFLFLISFVWVGFATIIHNPDAGVYYTDEHWVTYKMWTITIDSGWKTMTILDRDLWAKTYWFHIYQDWSINVNFSDDAFGFAFQWGNNYGFKTYKWEIPNPWGNDPYNINYLRDTDLTWNTQVNASGYGPYNYYSSNIYFVWSNQSNRDSSNNDNLWGWRNDFWWKNYDLNDIEYTSLNRQWPCPNWYHIPSESEWEELYKIWKWVDNMHNSSNVVRPAEWFFRDFLIPSWVPSGISSSSSPYWTTSVFNNDSAYVAVIRINGVLESWDISFPINERSRSAYVRCFKDPDNTYESQYPNMKIVLKTWWNVLSVPTKAKSVYFVNGWEWIIFTKLVNWKWTNVPAIPDNITPLEWFLIYNMNKKDVIMYIVWDTTDDVTQNIKTLNTWWNLLWITTPILPFNGIPWITSYLDFTKYNGENSSNSIENGRDLVSDLINNYELWEAYGIFVNWNSIYQWIKYQYTTNNYYSLCELDEIKAECDAWNEGCPYRCRWENYYIDCNSDEIKAKCELNSEECPFACKPENYVMYCNYYTRYMCENEETFEFNCPESCRNDIWYENHARRWTLTITAEHNTGRDWKFWLWYINNTDIFTFSSDEDIIINKITFKKIWTIDNSYIKNLEIVDAEKTSSYHFIYTFDATLSGDDTVTFQFSNGSYDARPTSIDYPITVRVNFYDNIQLWDTIWFQVIDIESTAENVEYNNIDDSLYTISRASWY